MEHSIYKQAASDLYANNQPVKNEVIKNVKSEAMENPNTEWTYFNPQKDHSLYEDFENPISHCLQLDPIGIADKDGKVVSSIR